MYNDTNEMVTTILSALRRCQKHATEYLSQLLQIVIVMILPYPGPFLDIRHRSWNGQIEIRTDAMYFLISYHICVFGAKRGKRVGEASTFPPFLSLIHILPICLDSAQLLHIYHPQIEPQEQYFTGHRHFHVIHTQLVIDNAGYIYNAEAGFRSSK